MDSAFHIFLFFSKLFHLFQIFFLLFWCCFLCHLGLSIFYASTCNIVSHNFFLVYPDVCFSFLAVMHRLQLIHTDLKPENILLVSSDYVKLPDPKVFLPCTWLCLTTGKILDIFWPCSLQWMHLHVERRDGRLGAWALGIAIIIFPS